ncbi:MAG: hypothetical protein GY771_06550 [bacterium]|nr:hypothetical protein [bacterium]
MLKYALLTTLLAFAVNSIATDNGNGDDVIHGLLAAEAERQAGIESVKGGVVMYYIGEDAQEFACGYVRDFERGARLEIRGILGEILFVVTAEDDEMMLYSKASKSAVVCPATRENLAVLLGLDIGGNIYQLLDWVSGIAPLRDDEPGLTVEVKESEGDRVTVGWTADDGNPLQNITFDTAIGAPVASRLYDDGAVLADIVYSDFEQIDGVPFAKSVNVNTDDMRLEVTFNRVALNDEVNPKAFSTEPPGGTEIITIDEAVIDNSGDSE